MRTGLKASRIVLGSKKAFRPASRQNAQMVTATTVGRKPAPEI
jgi:hypothetical protein